ncbi:Protein of unknown function [Flavobacteriaceae bacterium MAR_2010_188]|nr:Protein of unknown function [Flavobacteriaceae bacterium MAR_2010_188]
MIVRTSKKGYHIIYHACHGVLSGLIASQISEEYRGKFWFETMIATTDHDDRQLNFTEKQYLSDLGIPMDFTQNEETVAQILKRCNRVLHDAQNKSRWIYILISLHIDFLYKDLAESSKQIKVFLSEHKDLRNMKLKDMKIKESEANKSYEILRFCDRLSLILSKDEIPSRGRKLEINRSIDDKEYFIFRNEDESISIDPWIFTDDEFELHSEERILQTAQFNNQTDFEKQLNSCSVSILKWKLRKS